MSALNSHGGNIVCDNINEELAKIDDSLNIKKSKFMLFYMPGRNLQIPNLHIDNIKLECLDSFNSGLAILPGYPDFSRDNSNLKSSI